MHQQDIQGGKYYFVNLNMVADGRELKGTYLMLCEHVEDGVAVLVDVMRHIGQVSYTVEDMAADDRVVPVSSDIALKAQCMALTAFLDKMAGMHREASDKVDGRVTTH